MQNGEANKVMARLTLNRDFTRFLEDETFPHRVEVHLGEKALVCSGMVLAQQSSIIEELIREDCGVLMFEKMQNIGTIDHKLDCIKFMYGSPVAFSLQNIDTVIRFSSLYGVLDLFHKSVQWIANSISARNLFTINDISKSLENKDHKSKLNKVVSNFMINNSNSLGVELAEKIAHGDDVDPDLFVSIIKQNPENGADILKGWTKKCSENKIQVLEAALEFDFVTLFPAQADFTAFVAQLSEGLDSVDVMKQVLALQQDYFVKSAIKAAQPPPPTGTCVEFQDAEDKQEEEEEAEDDQDDAASSVASSVNTTNTAGKPKSRRGGKNRNKKDRSTTETWKADKPGHHNQKKQNVPPSSKNKPTTNQPKNVHSHQPKNANQSKNVNKQGSTNSKPGLAGKRKVFVANVPSNATANDIKTPFMFGGVVVNIDVHSHKNIAFIEFSNERSATTILTAAKSGVKFTVLGQTVAVHEYTPGKGSKPSVAHAPSSVV